MSLSCLFSSSMARNLWQQQNYLLKLTPQTFQQAECHATAQPHSPTPLRMELMGNTKPFVQARKREKKQKKMVMMLFYSAGLGLLAVQWRWWKVRRHQMGWYTFIFRNEINHHHSYNQKHIPAIYLMITSDNCLKTTHQLPDKLTAWWQPRYCQRHV